MLTATQDQRVDALSKALHWYDAAKAWAEFDSKKKSLLTVKSFKDIDQANALRERAHASERNWRLKEDSLRAAVELYEGALKEAIKTKPISTIYDKLSRIADRLKRKEERVTAKYKKFLDIIVDAVHPSNTSGEIIQLKVHDPDMKNPPKERWVSPDVRILRYSKKHAEEMFNAYKKDGLLSVINMEMKTLSSLGAFPYDPKTDKWHIDPLQQVKTVIHLYDNVAKYLRDNPQMLRKFVRKKKAKKVVKRSKKGKKK